MTRLKRLSARQIIRILYGFGFSVASVRGSHAKLKREIEGRPPQVLTVPVHRELAPGTIQAIYRQALRFVPEADLRAHFTSLQRLRGRGASRQNGLRTLIPG